MALSTPTGVLVLAMLVGQAAGFARVPKDAAEKGGDLIPSRMSYSTGSTCTGTDSSTWKDAWGDGCDWYAEYDPGCFAISDSGQKTNCPVACNQWKDAWGNGCDVYAKHDPGCSYYDDDGQKTNCPVACNHKCFCPPGKVLIDGGCVSTFQACAQNSWTAPVEGCVQTWCHSYLPHPGSTCTGSDSSTWKDAWGDGCDWYAAHDLGCRTYDDFGQKTNCPVACNHKCFCPPGKVLIDGECTSASQLCDSEFERCVQEKCGWLLRALGI